MEYHPSSLALVRSRSTAKLDGNGYSSLALVNADGNATYWSNDGVSVAGSEPRLVAAAVNGGRRIYPPWKHRPARHGGD